MTVADRLHNATAEAELDAELDAAIERFKARNPKSLERHQDACKAMPGGNTRSILHFDPAPLTIGLAHGCMMEDIDGNRYVDFLGEYSAGLYGHSHPVIQQTIADTLEMGLSYGAPNKYEAKFAKLICERFPAIDLVRFCNSGSEATLMTLSIARAVTGRDMFIAFSGAYHGGFLMMDGSHDQLNVPHDITCTPYNDPDAAKALIHEIGDQLAGVIVEPMIGAGGCIPAEPGFLETLRSETEAVGALLIFDEVITSRLSSGGMQEKTGVMPDLTALGKYLGGGMTFGAFGGRSDLMERFNPKAAGKNAFYHAGTFNNNILTMATGWKALSEVYTPRAAQMLNANGEDLKRRLNVLFRQHKIEGQVTGIGSIMGFQWTGKPVRCPEHAHFSNPSLKRLFHLCMLEKGQYLAPRGMITVSLPMGHREFDGLTAAVHSFMKEYAPLIRAVG